MVGMKVAVALSIAASGMGAQLESLQAALETSWGKQIQDSKASRQTPVQRVRKLLNKMKDELQADAKQESKMYDKMVCWCETNEKEKNQAVRVAESTDIQLGSEIEERSARVGELAATIEQLKKDIADNTNNLEQATGIREKEAAEFRDEEKDMVQAITNLRNAITVLSKHQKGGALVQIEGSVLNGMRVLIRDAALKYEVLVAGRAERRGEKALALISIRESKNNDRSAEGATSAALFSAMDVHGLPVSELPVKFAARVVAEAAVSSKAFLQVPHKPASYSSQSNGIYGHLTQMLEEFEGELSTSQKEELKGQADFKALADAKTAEIETGKRKLDEMQMEDSDNSKSLSDAKEDLTNTREQRSNDVEFLRNLRVTCNDIDGQWDKRRSTRNAEMTAVSEAIAILTDDDNREALAKNGTVDHDDFDIRSMHADIAINKPAGAIIRTRTRSVSSGLSSSSGGSSRTTSGIGPPTFLQESVVSSASTEAMMRRSNAVAVLRRAAANPEFQADDLLAAWKGRSSKKMIGAAAGPRAQLSTLAIAVNLDGFTKVKEMMDKMVAELKKEQQEMVEFKGYCLRELARTKKLVEKKTNKTNELEIFLRESGERVEGLTEEIDYFRDQIDKTKLAILKAGQTREEENKEFQKVVAEQRAIQAILKKVLVKLKDFYDKGINKAVLAQQTPPVHFNDYENHHGGSPVIGLIEQIVEESKAFEKEVTAAEKQAQADYEKFVKECNKLIASLQAAVDGKLDLNATSASSWHEADADIATIKDQTDTLKQLLDDLHAECDWLLFNFDIRQRARIQEMEAILNAKGILSGDRSTGR